MPIRSFLMSLLLLALSITAALGSDSVSGTLTVNKRSLPVRYVYALLHDNAEGVLDSSPELRILVTDREVPVSSLYGLTFLPVGDLARSGEVQGIILRFDPAKLGEIDLTILVPNALQKVTDRIKITNFSLGTERIKGTFEFKEDSFQSFPNTRRRILASK